MNYVKILSIAILILSGILLAYCIFFIFPTTYQHYKTTTDREVKFIFSAEPIGDKFIVDGKPCLVYDINKIRVIDGKPIRDNSELYGHIIKCGETVSAIKEMGN